MEIIVDSSILIHFFNKQKPKEKLILRKMEILSVFLKKDALIYTIGPVITEILQGVKFSNKKQYSNIAAHLDSFIFLPLELKNYYSAAEIYRFLRSKGITIESTIDVILASASMDYSIPLLHCDSDFEIIKKHFYLQTIK